jgi:predicted nucleic acid-binding protein
MTLSFVLADEFSADSEHVLSAVARDGAVVPALWDFEVLNGLRSAERRGRLTEAAVTHAWAGLSRLSIERDRSGIDGEHVVALSREHHLSVYDAAYLQLALVRNLPLASLDESLLGAARRAGVLVIG